MEITPDNHPEADATLRRQGRLRMAAACNALSLSLLVSACEPAGDAEPVSPQHVSGTDMTIEQLYGLLPADSCQPAEATISPSPVDRRDTLTVAAYRASVAESVKSVTSVLNEAGRQLNVRIGILEQDKIKPYRIDGYEPDDLESIKDNAATALRGLANIPPGLFELSRIDSITLAENISSTDGSQDVGLLLGTVRNKFEIFLDSHDPATIIHESVHGLTAALCFDDSSWNDKNLTILSGGRYVGSDYSSIRQADYERGPERRYATPYGATDFFEDTSEMLAVLFYTEGAVMPGDPDWGSPYHLKQLYLIRRLEHIQPGTEQYLKALADEYRKPHGNVAAESVPTSMPK